MIRVTVSFVLRLVPERLARGEVTGEVQYIGDGTRVLVRSIDELEAFLVAAVATPEDADGLR